MMMRYRIGAYTLIPVLVLGMGCASRPKVFVAESLRSQFDLSTKQGEQAGARDGYRSVTPYEPVFSYDAYCDTQGHFIYDGAALALLQRPKHLRQVYLDADKDQARAKQVIRELEHVFRGFGAWVANETSKPECLVLSELIAKCLPRLGFLTKLFGSSPEVQRLREVAAQEYEVRARERGVQNQLIVATLNALLAVGMVKGVLTKAAGSPLRPPEGNTLTENAPKSERMLPFKDFERLSEINKTLDRIKNNGSFPYKQDGTIFRNGEGRLPLRENGYYREYTVVTPGAPDRGTRRIVQGKGGETYYTDDHYESFIRIDTGEQ